MPSAITLYAVLGVTPNATLAEISLAYTAREQALQGKPDELSLLRVAYDTLREPGRRLAYDRTLAHQQANNATTASAVEPPLLPVRRSGGRWRLLVAVASSVLAFFWLSRPAPVPDMPGSAPLPASAPATLAAAAPLPDTRTAVVATAPAPRALAPAASTTYDDAGRAAPTAPPIDAAETAPAAAGGRSRAPRQAGFDANYLAWSVFTIRQRAIYGSGVLIGPDRILTNCHVVAGGAIDGIVVIHSVTQKPSKVEKYARLDDEDACLLFAPGAGSDPIPWGNSAALRPGDTVHTFGHPDGSTGIMWSEGRFLERVERDGDTFLFSNNYCRPGSSGGPLLDDQGRLVGVVAAVRRFQTKTGEPPRYGACISVSEAAARALLSKPLFPIAMAPARYFPNY